MSYVHNQLYGISCATLYIVTITKHAFLFLSKQYEMSQQIEI